MEKSEENMSDMTEIQMFRVDGISDNTNTAGNASRTSFKNPYMYGDKVTPGINNSSALKTNNTSGIKSSLYSSNMKFSSGIKSYEQNVGDQGRKNEPVYPSIQRFEGQSRQ